jgi:hypothetical protein
VRILLVFAVVVVIAAVVIVVRRNQQRRALKLQAELKAARARAARKAAIPLVSASLRGVSAQSPARAVSTLRSTTGPSDQAA